MRRLSLCITRHGRRGTHDPCLVHGQLGQPCLRSRLHLPCVATVAGETDHERRGSSEWVRDHRRLERVYVQTVDVDTAAHTETDD